tara:strand:- start:928 stop:1347 length:420 start_codon:yes stop_codon:yes gene_type:complete
LNNKLSEKDKKDWLKFINSNEEVQDKDKEDKNSKLKILEKSIDLHGYSLEKANITINKFINECFVQRVEKITIITGKGSRSKTKNDPYQSEDLSILKYSVPEYIKTNNKLMKIIREINLNQVQDSAKGSFEVFLKKIKE